MEENMKAKQDEATADTAKRDVNDKKGRQT
jgi:hypothetical protein